MKTSLLLGVEVMSDEREKKGPTRRFCGVTFWRKNDVSPNVTNFMYFYTR